MGRKDHQAKLRGQRLELSEVERHLRLCFPGVIDVIADVVFLQGQTTESLVAFVWDGNESAPETTEQRPIRAPDESFARNSLLAEAVLRSRVPSFMVPTVFLPLSGVPYTATGKVDRRLLRDSAQLAAQELHLHRAGSIPRKSTPSTPMGRRLQAVWAAVLRLDTDAVGGDDHFFHLGGDSLTAMSVVARLRDWDLRLTVADVLSHPIPNDQALLVAEGEGTPNSSLPPPFSLLGVCPTAGGNGSRPVSSAARHNRGHVSVHTAPRRASGPDRP